MAEKKPKKETAKPKKAPKNKKKTISKNKDIKISNNDDINNSGKAVEKKARHGIENLTHWKKGQSGNPNGRPPGKSITTILKNLLEKEIVLTKNPITGKKKEKQKISEVIALTMVREAIKGKDKFIKEILDRTEGKVLQGIDHGGSIGMIPDLTHLNANELLELVERTTQESS
jgi:hypothetical protein